MKRTSLMRRLTAGVASLAIGMVGALALAAPASAEGDYGQHKKLSKKAWVKVEGIAECIEDQWHITWTVKNKTRVSAKVHEINREVDGIAVGDQIDARSQLIGTEVLDGAEVGEVTLEVTLKWHRKLKKTASYTVNLGEDCTPDDEPEEPEVPEELGSWVFDCDVLTITLTNPFEDALSFTFTPSVGEPADLNLPAGESGSVEFPASEGLSIAVAVEGEPIELEEPIEITSEAWAAAGCAEGDDGEGGELPVTGTSTALMAAAALAMLAVGGGLFLVARRRRVTFTA